jgi:D-3-phosphoglycerate dehydrogenase
VVFNTPGANANGVKELVLAGMFLAARDVVDGINWVRENEHESQIAKLTEKQKKAFAGTELDGKKLGVIGLGAIGVLVANAAVHLGMDVYGYDPYLSVDAAWKLSRNIHHATSVEELYQECDYLTIHIPATEETKGMIDADAIAQMKDHVVLLNFARDLLVDEDAMVRALKEEKVHRYVTDFPTPKISGVEGAIVIPHLGASTEESEDNCARMAVRQTMDYLENGNIKHSVNYPDCELGKFRSGTRITILHHNIPNMIGQFTAVLAKENLNLSVMANKSKGQFAYTMMDVEDTVPHTMEAALNAIDGVLKVRMLVKS